MKIWDFLFVSDDQKKNGVHKEVHALHLRVLLHGLLERIVKIAKFIVRCKVCSKSRGKRGTSELGNGAPLNWSSFEIRFFSIDWKIINRWSDSILFLLTKFSGFSVIALHFLDLLGFTKRFSIWATSSLFSV